MNIDIIIILISLLLSAFFSGMEIAYVSSNKIHIEIEKKQDDFIAKMLTKLTKSPSRFIASMLIGNNIALVIYGFFMGDVLVHWFQSFLPSSNSFLNAALTDFSLLSQTVISTIIILITAEFLPKVFFQIYANNLIKVLAVPAYFFYWLFGLITNFVIWLTDFILKKYFQTEGDNVQLAFTKIEIGNYISEQLETVTETDDVDSEIQIFQNALEFSEVKAREIMVPRTEITAVELHETPKTISKLFTETGYSKVLVYKDTIDDILGYVHSFELFKKPKTTKSIILPVEFVPETMLIKDILKNLTKKRKSIAVVLDEYGGTAGILTVEDIVEELFGEIEDEHDNIDLVEEKIDENSFMFSARLEVDYLNDTYKLNLPEDENYETLGGLIVSHTENIPDKDDIIQLENIELKIVEVSNTKIDLVHLEIKDSE